MWRSHRGCSADGKRAQAPQVFVRDTELNTTRPCRRRMGPIAQRRRTLRRIRRTCSTGWRTSFSPISQTGTTRIITNSARRGLANGASGKPKVSSDGRFVAFQSEASDLVAAEDFNLLWDVFVFDRTTGTTTRVSGDPDRSMDGAERRPLHRRTRIRRRLLLAPPDRRLGQEE